MTKLGTRLLLVILTGLLIGAFCYGASQRQLDNDPASAQSSHELQTLQEPDPDLRQATSSSESVGKVDSVDVLTQGLERRLEKDPEDVNGWLLLGKSYQYLGSADKADEAFEKARALGYTGETPSVSEAAPQNVTRPQRRGPLFPPVDTRILFKGMSALPPGNSKIISESVPSTEPSAVGSQ